MIPTTQFNAYPGLSRTDAATKSKDYIKRHWKYQEPAAHESGDIFARAKSHTLCISGMAFQDAWNLDLQRLRRCCIHVVTPEKKLIPFCSYYLTGHQGQRLVGRGRSPAGGE